MSVSLGKFDPNKAPSRNQPLPAGNYKMVIIKSEKKETKNKKGSFLELVLEVVEGPHKGRKIFERLNLWNSNATAVEIATATLGEIGRALGGKPINNTAEIHNKPLMAKVIVKAQKDKEGKDTGDVGNEIRQYSACSKTKEKPQAEKRGIESEDHGDQTSEASEFFGSGEDDPGDDDDDDNDENTEERITPPWKK